MNILYNNEKERKAVVKFFNYYLIDFIKWANKNEIKLDEVYLSLPTLMQFTEMWLEKEAEILTEILDKSENRENE